MAATHYDHDRVEADRWYRSWVAADNAVPKDGALVDSLAASWMSARQQSEGTGLQAACAAQLACAAAADGSSAGELADRIYGRVRDATAKPPGTPPEPIVDDDLRPQLIAAIHSPSTAKPPAGTHQPAISGPNAPQQPPPAPADDHAATTSCALS